MPVSDVRAGSGSGRLDLRRVLSTGCVAAGYLRTSQQMRERTEVDRTIDHCRESIPMPLPRMRQLLEEARPYRVANSCSRQLAGRQKFVVAAGRTVDQYFGMALNERQHRLRNDQPHTGCSRSCSGRGCGTAGAFHGGIGRDHQRADTRAYVERCTQRAHDL